MAIGSGGLENPYVHSDIDRWKRGDGSIPLTLADEVNVKEAIAKLEKVSAELKREAEEFLGGKGVDVLNYCVDHEYNSYAQIAVQLLQDPDAIASLTQGDLSKRMSGADVNNLIQDVPEILKSRIEKILPTKEITEESARNIAMKIAAAISDSDGVLITSKFSKVSIINEVGTDKFAEGLISKEAFKGLEGQAKINKLQEMTGKRTTDIKNLRGGDKFHQVVNMIENIIENRGLYQSTGEKRNSYKDGLASFMDWFTKRFIVIAGEEVPFFNTNQTPQDYLKAFETQLRNKFKKGNVSGNAMNIVGALGDEFYVSAYEADEGVTIKIKSVGTVKEQDVERRFKKEFQGLGTLKTHHAQDKQSQTDILISNANGKTVRVQAKNSSLENQQYSNNDLINLNAHLEREKKLSQLLLALNIPDAEQIMYTVVNALWFGTHESVSGKRSTGKLDIETSEADSSILPKLSKELSILYSTKAENFIGITIKEAVANETQILKGGASNIFFLKNGRLIPTYTLVDEVIKDLNQYLKEEEEKLHGLHFSIKGAKKTAWQYNKAVDYWLAKAENNFANVEQIGLAQGQVAVSSLIINGDFPKVTALVINTNS